MRPERRILSYRKSGATRNARREIKRKLVYRLWYRFADCLGTETLAEGKNSNARAERETRAGTFLRPRAAIYARKRRRGKERERKGSSPQENLAGRKSFRAAGEATSGRRETSLITAGFGIEFHPPTLEASISPAGGRRVPSMFEMCTRRRSRQTHT